MHQYCLTLQEPPTGSTPGWKDVMRYHAMPADRQRCHGLRPEFLRPNEVFEEKLTVVLRKQRGKANGGGEELAGYF